jgi:hypothetical protein
MFRIQANIIKENHILKHKVITNDSNDNRTKKVLDSLALICYEFDLPVPSWFDYNIKQFKEFSKVRFNSDNFIEEVNFDYLELTMLDED